MKNVPSILNTENLAIGYRSKKREIPIAKNLDLEVKQGQLIAVLGKNGVGKSTLLRTLLGLQPALIGTINLDGKLLSRYTALGLAKKMAVVLTDQVPENNLTVYELIALGRQPYTNWLGTLNHRDREAIDMAIEQCGVHEYRSKRFYELSDGQRQRVMIARALAQNTELIVLDEPTVHLDIQHKLEVFSLLERLVCEHRKTILLSTHEINTALDVAHQIWLMHEQGLSTGSANQLIETGAFSKLFDSSRVHFDVKTRRFNLKG